MTGGFDTIYGRGLVGELPVFAHPPYLVVTMPDLWPRFRGALETDALAAVHLVGSLEVEDLERSLVDLPTCSSVIGIGGGQAIDVAKFIAWRRGRPLFQAPTSMSVNAPFGQRAGLRRGGIVRYLGWAVPEAVYVDFDVISSAPARLNRAGVGDILCYHTAHLDWRLSRDLHKTEPRWPFDQGLIDAAAERMAMVIGAADEIRASTDSGIRTLMEAHRWGGAAFHAAGWNPRHIEGLEHFFFYNLERQTGRHFIHGQPVLLGVLLGSILHGSGVDEMGAAMLRIGVDIRPEAMGVTWDAVALAMRSLASFVREVGLWHSIVDERVIDDQVVNEVRARVDALYGPWTGERA